MTQVCGGGVFPPGWESLGWRYRIFSPFAETWNSRMLSSSLSIFRVLSSKR